MCVCPCSSAPLRSLLVIGMMCRSFDVYQRQVLELLINLPFFHNYIVTVLTSDVHMYYSLPKEFRTKSIIIRTVELNSNLTIALITHEYPHVSFKSLIKVYELFACCSCSVTHK